MINNLTSIRPDINEIMSKIREVSSKSSVLSESKVENDQGNFKDMLSLVKNAISNVNDVQTNAETLKNSYVSGDGNVSLSQVILASEKSKLAFEGLISVRNKILESYKEIMNMQV